MKTLKHSVTITFIKSVFSYKIDQDIFMSRKIKNKYLDIL